MSPWSFGRLALAALLAASTAQAGRSPAHRAVTAEPGATATSQPGAEYSLPQGIRVSAAPGTVLKISRRAEWLNLKHNQRTPAYHVVVQSGRVDISVPAGKRVAVLVSTPKKTGAIVTRGLLTSIVSPDRTLHANRNGDVLVRVGAGWKTVGPGLAQSWQAGKSVIRPPVPAAQSITGQLLRASLAGRAAVFRDISWTPVTGASDYEVQFESIDVQGTLRNLRTREPRLASALVAPSAGSYTLRVRALDANGLEGPWSVAELKVISAEVPPGSLVGADGVLYLAPGAAAGFEKVQGLEMAVNNRKRFVPSANRVGLYRGEPTSIVFRRPSDQQTVVFRMAPRGEIAEVALTPHLATWPRDPVEIEITLRAPGRASLSEVHPVTHVSLGGQPLTLNWQKLGNRLRAVVRPRHGGGPWVLRVEVTDQRGGLLGRNFLEIAQTHPATDRAAD
ncbi:MAG TPA: hypothetical protein VGJ84_13320 [Polyangiaceae bacterium]